MLKRLTTQTRKIANHPIFVCAKFAAIPLTALTFVLITQREALAGAPKDWSFGKCYSDITKKFSNAPHEVVVAYCNCMIKIGPQFSYELKATTNYCEREVSAQTKAQQEEVKARQEVVTERRSTDRFGLPTLDPKRYGEPNVSSDGKMDYYTDFKSFRLLKNKGEYNRYFAWEEIGRWMADPIAATTGYQMQTSGGSTQCYGSAYGSYGSAYGSSNCYTTPPSSIYIPGSSGSAGGPRQKTITVILDCIDRTVQYDKRGKWKPFTAEKFADKLCAMQSDPTVQRGEEI